MAVRCRDEAEKILGPHFEAFATIVLESVQFYYSFYGERAHTHEPWTRCSIIRDEIKERLTAYCESARGLQPLRDSNATYFGVHSKITIRIKKLFDNLHANTGKTQLSFDFDHQVSIAAELFEDLDPTNIYLGYVATENDPLNPAIYLVCNNEVGEIAWNIPLTLLSPPPTTVINPSAPSSPDVPRRAHVKPIAAIKKVKND
jgi:hypothetical protein